MNQKEHIIQAVVDFLKKNFGFEDIEIKREPDDSYFIILGNKDVYETKKFLDFSTFMHREFFHKNNIGNVFIVLKE